MPRSELGEQGASFYNVRGTDGRGKTPCAKGSHAGGKDNHSLSPGIAFSGTPRSKASASPAR